MKQFYNLTQKQQDKFMVEKNKQQLFNSFYCQTQKIIYKKKQKFMDQRQNQKIQPEKYEFIDGDQENQLIFSNLQHTDNYQFHNNQKNNNESTKQKKKQSQVFINQQKLKMIIAPIIKQHSPFIGRKISKKRINFNIKTQNNLQSSIMNIKSNPKQKAITIKFIKYAKLYFQNYNKQILYKNSSLKSLAQQTGYSYFTVYNLYNKWKEDPALKKQIVKIQNLPQSGDRSGRWLYTKLKQQIIFRILNNNPLLSSKEVANILAKDPIYSKTMNCQDSIRHYHAVASAFTALKLKKIRLRLISSIRNYPEDIMRRRQYCKQMKNVLKNQKVIFLDEMAVNQWIRRDRAWGMKNQNISNVMIHLKRQSFLIVSVMDNKGVPLYQVIHGNQDKSKYEAVIDSLLNIFCKMEEKNITVVIYAAVGHQARESMKKVSELKQFNVIILPPFSELLNPLYYWFRQIRLQLKRKAFENDRQLMMATTEALQNLTKNKQIPNYFAWVIKNLEKGLNGQNF